MASDRRAIHDKLIDILKTITVDNGYHNDIASVTKRLKDIETVQSFPALSLIGGEETFERRSEEENLYEVTSSFWVIGYVKTDHDAADTGSLSSAGDDLIDDVIDAIANNIVGLFNSTAAKSLRLVSDESVLDFQNNWGYVSVSFEVTYYRGLEEEIA